MIKAKSFILSIVLIWLSGGSAIFHTHPFLDGALSGSDRQICYTQHKDTAVKIISCPACLWERTPTDTTPLNSFTVFCPELPAVFGVSAPQQLSPFNVHLSPRSPPLFF